MLPNVTTLLGDYKGTLQVSQRYMLSWHNSRLGFVTPIVGEVSLGPLGNAHHYKVASNVTNDLVVGRCITE